ncbi:hypothetical protein [Candidatus Nanohalovita haloferacivicina]|uniref:hypothetical protein n=1 Tax=Candidatus Nanohalovita haloferacivicina TaxID=2978046 RepID=UPI00325FB0F5|nr:hypothetical protein HBNXNv_0081 [Candidatus Nanohalobia archaeon BNXNv]
MRSLQAERAYEEFGIPEAAHFSVLENASQGRPWTPDVISRPGVEIDENVYAEGVLREDPREKQDRHDLLIDGRLQRYANNIEQGRSKWDLVLTERDFYQHPDNLGVEGGVDHERKPETHLKMGDGDLIFLDLDRYEAHMVEVKPNDSYAAPRDRPLDEEIDPSFWEDSETGYRPSQGSADESGGAVMKKTAAWRDAWASVLGELDNDWSVYQPEFVFGSDVLDERNLLENSEFALPPQYSDSQGYAVGTEYGFSRAAEMEDLQVLNELFFRDGISEIVEGERPEMDGESVF